MTSRNQSLDVLRGLAVLLVIFDHYSLVMQRDDFLLASFGRGVDLFFVLSGFLISGLLFAEYKKSGHIHLKRFWIRRGFKIYPAFYFFIAATTVLSLAGPVPHKLLLNEALLLQGYFAHFWVHTWSLAVEEHFYFGLPLLLLLLMRLSRNRSNPFKVLPFISILISGSCLYMRILAARSGSQIGLATHLRIDALFAGVAIGYFWHFDRESFRDADRWWVLAIGVITTLSLPLLPIFLQLTFAYVGFSFVLAWTVSRQRRTGHLSAAFAFVGRYSYSIYLWHVIAVIWCVRLPQKWFRFPVYICAAVVLGLTMSKLIELPMLHLRDVLFPSRTRQTRNYSPLASGDNSDSHGKLRCISERGTKWLSAIVERH